MGQFFLEKGAISQILDHLNGAVFLLSENEKVIYFNAEAHNLLNQNSMDVKIVKDRLVWLNKSNSDNFKKSMHASRTEGRYETSFISNPFPFLFQNQERRSAFIFRSRATSKVRIIADDKENSFHILFIDAPQTADALNHISLRNLYQFTEAESRLARALCQGQNIQEFADQYEVSIHTVRNQIRSIMQKTGDRRQTQMIQRIMKETKLRTLFHSK